MEITELTEIKEKEPKKSPAEIFKENKTAFYSVLFYTAGLLLGAFIYVKCSGDALNELIKMLNSTEFLTAFINNLGFYFLVYAVTVLLGICLVGFPVIQIIPLVLGVQCGLETAYYYINFGIKGFGYNLLMIAPFVCSFLTLIIFTIEISYELSKSIYNITVNKNFDSEKIDYKKYLKKYLIYALIAVAVALVNSGVTAALSGIISI